MTRQFEHGIWPVAAELYELRSSCPRHRPAALMNHLGSGCYLKVPPGRTTTTAYIVYFLHASPEVESLIFD